MPHLRAMLRVHTLNANGGKADEGIVCDGNVVAGIRMFFRDGKRRFQIKKTNAMIKIGGTAK